MTLRIVDAGSARGRRSIERLRARGASVLDKKTLRAAGRLVRAVRKGGDSELLAQVAALDGVVVEQASALSLEASDPARDLRELPSGFADALERAIAAVERFHQGRAPRGYTIEEDGVTLEQVVSPLARVGVYVPGGRAIYPSTVVMTVVPARLARVREIVVATPPAAFQASAALRYTLARLGVDEVWGMGGAHAIAALAYGTESIARVDKIVGPGNAWVTAAKTLVSGDVAIDGVAGPTEVVIVADGGDGGGETNPAWVAADLLAQAEHDPRAAAVLLTFDRPFARRVAAEVARQLDQLEASSAPTAETARRSIARFGAAFVVANDEQAVEVVEAIAPEHLQLVGARSEALSPRIHHAGAVFLGASTSEVFGDYLAGPSHVLPTCGTARFASALGVEDFLRRFHRVRFSPRAAFDNAEAAAVLADAEGLRAHAAAARLRLDSDFNVEVRS